MDNPYLIKRHEYKSNIDGIYDNHLIYADNIDVLKALEQDYTGKIKCVYIDPPYNTKNKYSHYKDNLEHSKWLEFMRERLVILQRLLTNDGSIWISIDDNECHYLKVLCDEIFGRKNFVANVIWERAYAPINAKKTISKSHDHILVYAKNIIGIVLNKLPRSQASKDEYKNPDNDSRGVWMGDNLSVARVVNNNIYPIFTPSGREVWPQPGSSWRLSKSRFKEYLADNRIWFGKEGKNIPRVKKFLSGVKTGNTAMTLWHRKIVGDSQEAKREAMKLNSKNIFQTPKPERLLHRIIYLATNPGDIVLDSFAGSGTTGAVAHKMKRRWIMIEIGEHCHTHIIPRLEKVINGNDPGGVTKLTEWTGGGGFNYYEITKDENDPGMD